MSTLDYFRTLARYNQWANRTLYAAVGAAAGGRLHEAARRRSSARSTAR